MARIEFRGKQEDPRWRATWTWCTTVGSLLIPLLLGVGLGDLLHGLPIDGHHEYTGNFFDLLTPYGLWTGVTLLGLCLLHGATFLALKSTDDVRARARAVSRPLGWAAVGLVVGFVVWTRVVVGHTQVPGPVEVLAVIAVAFVDNPIPQISGLSPSTVTTLGAGSTLTLTGSGFVAASTVTWNGATHASTYVSSTQLNLTRWPRATWPRWDQRRLPW